MQSTSELRPLEQAQIELRQQSRGETQKVLAPWAAAADAFRQLSEPMIELVEAGLITISDDHGVLGADRAVAVLADPANWVQDEAAAMSRHDLASPATSAGEVTAIGFRGQREPSENPGSRSRFAVSGGRA